MGDFFLVPGDLLGFSYCAEAKVWPLPQCLRAPKSNPSVSLSLCGILRISHWIKGQLYFNIILTTFICNGSFPNRLTLWDSGDFLSTFNFSGGWVHTLIYYSVKSCREQDFFSTIPFPKHKVYLLLTLMKILKNVLVSYYCKYYLSDDWKFLSAAFIFFNKPLFESQNEEYK